jgi:hypothetical protein
VATAKLFCVSEDHPATEDVKFIGKTKFPAKFLLQLAVSEYGVIASRSFLTIFKCLSVLHMFIQNHHKMEKIVFLPDLASAHYAKDAWAWKGLTWKGLQQELSSKRCKVLDGKDQKRVETSGIRKAMKKVPVICV